MSKLPASTFLSMFLMFSSSTSWGVIERETFDVSVAVPLVNFHVSPVDPQLVERPQYLPYNHITDEIGPLRALFNVKNAHGAIDGRLGEQAYLSNGRERIDLRVTFNNVQLDLQPRQVVSDFDAGIGKIVNLEVTAIKPAAGYSPGRYQGTVHMVFDALAP